MGKLGFSLAGQVGGFRKAGETLGGGGGGGMSIGGAISGATPGSVLFAGSGGVLAQDNADFFWNASTKRLGIGTSTPATDLSVKPATDGTAVIGRLRIDSRTSGVAHLSHEALTGTTEYGVQLSSAGSIVMNARNASSTFAFAVGGTARWRINTSTFALEDVSGHYIELRERATPAGSADRARLYAKDNGSGKTQLVVIFGSGAEQVLATEP
jgi:hypothetical protein